MDEINTKWLPHLAPEIVSEIENNYLDAYVVALEGWRRGLTLRWHVKDSEKFKEMKTWYVDEPGLLFSLHSKERSHYFFRTRGDKVTNEAVELGMDKEATKRMLAEKGIPVPEGREFTEEATEDEIVTYAKNLGYPVVIKPTDGSFGRGVIANITTDSECRHALDYVRNELNEENIIVEKYIEGNDYRLYVVDDEVVGAILRVPPNVTGDGINSIEALIDIKNEERKLNPRLADTLIKINKELVDYIGRFGYTLKSVPDKGEKIYLSDKCNISIGGDPIDVLDELSDEIKQLAVDALRAVPGLVHGAVDLIIHKEDDGTEKGYVIELNPTAQIGGILFPLKGKPRDIPKAIIDFYFPETKDVQLINAYFNIKETLEPLYKNFALSTKVINIWKNDFESKHFIIKGHVNHMEFQQIIRNEALSRGLIGKISLLTDNTLTIIAAGSTPMLKKFKKFLSFQEQVDTIEEKDWNKLIGTGFEIEYANKKLIKDIQNQQKRISELRNLKIKVEKEFYGILNSTSWKITLPIRVITGIFRKKIKSI